MTIYKSVFLNILLLHLLSIEKCFLFSVIISIYNTGRYLDDSIGSLINQTINFENIQVILVNDGSLDNTEEICLKYQEKYQKNIIYIKIEHSGVSKARNIGMNYAFGKYINFLDSDDKWDYRAFENILLFFENYPNIDFVAGRIKFFEAYNDYHPLDYKFYKTRVVNLNKEYKCIQTSASSSVFRKSLLEGKKFNERVYFCEDYRFVNNLLLINPVMGLIKEAIYYYRKRSDFSSAVQNQKKKLDFYFGTLNFVSKYLFNYSWILYNKIIPFIQYLISYELLFRIQSPAFKFLDSCNFQKYKLLIDKLLKQIDDKYILGQKFASNKYKLFILSKKYHRDLRNDIEFQNDSLFYSKYRIIDLRNEKNIIVWKILNVKNHILYLEGIDNFWMPRKQYNYFFKIGNKTYLPNYTKNPNYDFLTLYGSTIKGRIISFEIPLETEIMQQTFYFFISYLNHHVEIFPLLGIFYSNIIIIWKLNLKNYIVMN